MVSIRVTCQCCGAVARIRPAQVLLLPDRDRPSGIYLFSCPICGRVTARCAQPGEVSLLVDAGVTALGGEDDGAAPRPARQAGAAPPFTLDDLLDFHLLLAGADWFSQLA